VEHCRCGHDHFRSDPVSADKKRLVYSFLICVIAFAVELAGGYISKSLALTSDAFHMGTHILAFGFSYWARGFEKREACAGIANGFLLMIIAVSIAIYAYQRFMNPMEIDCHVMIGIAIFGFLANIGQVAVLIGRDNKSLSMSGIFRHVLSDAAFSVVVIFGGVSVYLTGFQMIDGFLAALFSILIFWGGIRLAIKGFKALK